MSGTIALIFLLWSATTQPGTPPIYHRSVLTPPDPGESSEFLDPNIPMHDFYDAKGRLEGGYDTTGELGFGSGRTIFSNLPVSTLPSCRLYLRSHYSSFEEAAESKGQVIQDARCVIIPPNGHLTPYLPGGYGLDGKPQDPFRVLRTP